MIVVVVGIRFHESIFLKPVEMRRLSQQSEQAAADQSDVGDQTVKVE